MGGVEGADSRGRKAGLDGRRSAAGPPGLGRDPQVAGVAALELGDDRRPGVEPAVQDLHGRAAERAGTVAELDARLAVEVQGADLEPGELGDAPAGVGDECGHGGGAQRRRGVGVDGPADGQVVQQALGVGGGQVVSQRRAAGCHGGRAGRGTRRRRCRCRCARASSWSRRRRRARRGCCGSGSSRRPRRRAKRQPARDPSARRPRYQSCRWPARRAAGTRPGNACRIRRVVMLKSGGGLDGE